MATAHAGLRGGEKFTRRTRRAARALGQHRARGRITAPPYATVAGLRAYNP